MNKLKKASKQSTTNAHKHKRINVDGPIEFREWVYQQHENKAESLERSLRKHNPDLNVSFLKLAHNMIDIGVTVKRRVDSLYELHIEYSGDIVTCVLPKVSMRSIKLIDVS